jgi:glycyl-tRNA synthetase beta chain
MKRTKPNATADFLLEIGCEEIPAGMLARAGNEFKVILEKYISTFKLDTGAPWEVLVAPRRIAALCPAIRLRQPDEVREVTGPPKSVAYDEHGHPTRAAVSFAAKQGVGVSDLFLVQTSRGEYIAARQHIRGREARELLAETLPRAIAEIPWPRSMYWQGADGPRFIRPIRWIVALLGGKVIPFRIGEVAAGRESSGHRFLGKRRIPIRSARDYRPKLRKHFVLVDPAERKKKIERELRAAVARKGWKAHHDPELEALVVNLNEYPAALVGDFDPAFLTLPREILITVMRDHQKYFAVEKRDGELVPHFLAVVNLDRDRQGQVRAGHERVLRARFTDAQFFWNADQKCRLADNLSRLRHVTYESRLGHYGAKVERMKSLAGWLATQWFNSGLLQADVVAAIRAAELAKCDLVTEMVREFPELQGIVGGLYARAQGEAQEISDAVYDHYRPAGMDEPIPRNVTGCAVALADKLDALAGCFTVGLILSGSSDPFALRRAALGVVRIILERALPVSLSATLSTTAGILSVNPPRIDFRAELQKQVMQFVLERARFLFRERLGFAFDEVNAVLAASADDLVDAHKRMEALRATRKTKNFEPLAVAFKRIRKILEKAGPPEQWRLPKVREELLAADEERALQAEARRVAGEAAAHRRAGKYREALHVIAGLRPSVDRFFDRVLVMAEDEAVRKNRLTLLSDLLGEFSTIADFSELGAEEGR